MNLDFETILFFFQTYKRWPNEIEKHYIEHMLNSPYNSVSQIYEPLFDRIKYKKMILNSAQVYELTNLLIDFYNQNKRFPYADEEYKGYNLYNFMYALKFYKLPISTSNKAILKKLHLFNGKNIHINVLNLINYFYINNKWPNKEAIFNDIKIGNFAKKIAKDSSNLFIGDYKTLSDLGFFNQIDKRVEIILEFYKNFKRKPYSKERYGGICIYEILRKIKKGTINISEKERLLLSKNGLI